jgi:4-amino-4-deoxy-L-arabinose transferase-like glycosyltransferase
MNTEKSANINERRIRQLFLAITCLVVFFWRLGSNGLFDLDEALYANCSREMMLSHNFVIPTVNHIPFYEKPPLIYWITSVFYMLFGRNELTTRLPSAIASVGVIAMLYIFGSRYFGEKKGWLAACIYALSPMILGTARQLTTDATLTFCNTAALLCFFIGYNSNSKQYLWRIGFWTACALGVLAKGAPGVFFPVIIPILYLLHQNQYKLFPTIKEMHLSKQIPGILIFLLIALPWHIAALKMGGHDFFQMYIIKQHLERFQGGDHAHDAPFFFYVPGLLLGFLPWSLFLLPAYFERVKQQNEDETAGLKAYLRIWAAVVFLLFSFSGSKLISYILPLYPAAALLTADWMINSWKNLNQKRLLLSFSMILLCLSGLLLTIIVMRTPLIQAINTHEKRPISLSQIPPGMFTWTGQILLVLTLASLMAVIMTWANRPQITTYCLLVGMLLFNAVAIGKGLPDINHYFMLPLQSLARDTDPTGNHSVLLYIGPPTRPSVLWYLPDSLFTHTNSAHIVQETTRWEDTMQFLHIHPNADILTSTDRGRRLLSSGMANLKESDGNWVLLKGK